MSSRDRSDRSGRTRPSAESDRGMRPRRQPTRQVQPAWDIDPAEIDRYLSGRPSREQDLNAPSNSRTRQDIPEGTAGQINRLQRAVGDHRSSQPRVAQRATRPPSVGRQQFADPETPHADEYEPSRRVETYTAAEYGDREPLAEEAPSRPVPRARRQPQRTRQSPSRRAQQPSPSRRQSVRPHGQTYDVNDDALYDDQLYADDPYLTYDDDSDWEPSASGRLARARPGPRSKPSLPRLTIPPSIANAELVNDIPSLAIIGTGILSMAMMAIALSNRLELVPNVIPTHVSASGVPENLKERGILWSIPLLAGALSLMNMKTAWFLARIDVFAARFMLGAALLVQFIAWVAMIRYLW